MRSREEEDRYRGDVTYDVWRSGGNVDRIDYDRVGDHFLRGDRVEDAARHEMRLQRPPEPQPTYEDYYGDQEQDD